MSAPAAALPNLVIAIDGPAASGKSTVARLVAARLGGIYVNTGDMYRAVTWVAQSAGIRPAEEPAGVAALLAGLDLHYGLRAGEPVLLLKGEPVPQAAIRAPAVAADVSHVAKIPAVREWLLGRQRETRRLGLVVMEGRDIGTVVFPDAPFKFFVTAAPEVRARRRLLQAGETADGATVASVAAEIAERDRLDSTRAVAPLRPAADAVVIDTDALTAAAVAERIAACVRAGLGRGN
ncbi:MAG: (d)CMP kinase [Lentisphaeria bacterium]